MRRRNLAPTRFARGDAPDMCGVTRGSCSRFEDYSRSRAPLTRCRKQARLARSLGEDARAASRYPGAGDRRRRSLCARGAARSGGRRGARFLGFHRTEDAMKAPKGMPWSAPVLIRKEGKKLAVELPPQVAADLKAGPGDVLNFTKLPEGDIQIWVVKKSGYASLKDMK